MRIVLRALIVLLLVHGVAEANSASAQDGDDDARTLFEGARIHYDRGEFEEAAESFSSAFEISGRTRLLYNIYLAHRDAGHPAEAATALRRYLEEMPEDEIADDRELLQSRLASLEAQAQAQADAQSAADSQATSDAQATTRAETQEETSSIPIGGVALVAVGGAAVVAGVVTAIITSGIEGDLEEACTGTVCGPEQQSDIDRGKTMALLTDIFLIGGAALAIGGALWWILGRSTNDVTPSVACISDGCRVGLQGSF